MTFTLPQLQYGYDGLEPLMDSLTIEIHHSKHHKAYCDKLNAALEADGMEVEDLVHEVFPQTSIFPRAVITNGGQFWNHSFFWESMTPNKQEPSDALKAMLAESFGSYENFIVEFTNESLGLFGSGWVWLCINQEKQLSLVKTYNHENPLMDTVEAVSGKLTPLLVIDLWEHAYYLKHQNRRGEYIKNFIELINWHKVGDRIV